MKSGIKGTIIAVLEPDASQNRRNVGFTAGTGTWRVITQCTFEHICTVQFLFEQIGVLLMCDKYCDIFSTPGRCAESGLVNLY